MAKAMSEKERRETLVPNLTNRRRIWVSHLVNRKNYNRILYPRTIEFLLS